MLVLFGYLQVLVWCVGSLRALISALDLRPFLAVAFCMLVWLVVDFIVCWFVVVCRWGVLFVFVAVCGVG